MSNANNPSVPPPSLITLQLSTPPRQLWPQLTITQRQAIIRLLSELINRRLHLHANKEANNEPR